jgi:hypothetical protein
MRKSLLAMAALMGVATLPAHAWRVNIDQETHADIGFATIVRGISEGKRSERPWRKEQGSTSTFHCSTSPQAGM